MKILKYITFILMTVIVFSSCEKDDNGHDVPPSTATNTVILFMPWAGNANGGNTLYDDILTNISVIERKIQSDGSLNNTRLFVSISTSPRDGALIEISYNARSRKCVRDTIEKYKWPTADPGAVMINRFSRIKQLSPTPNYSLIIGCHGMGWVPLEKDQKQYSRYMGGSSDDYRFSSEDLATALNYCGLHPRYILLDACYMANIEIAYDLRKTCDYLIASTSELMDYGMPYDMMWSELSSDNPDYGTICGHFYDFYKSYRMPYGTLSVIKLDEVDEMVRIMKEVNKEYDCDLMYQDGLLRLDDLQKLDGYINSVFYDFGSYIDNLCKNNPVLADEVRKQLNRLVPHMKSTENIYSEIEGRQWIPVKTFSGITISDPTQSNKHNAVNMKRYTDWWRATH